MSDDALLKNVAPHSAEAERAVLGAVLVEDVHYPAIVMQNRAVVMEPMRAEVKDNYVDYLATLRPGFPKTVTELAEKGIKLTAPQGEFQPHPSVYTRFKALGERPPLTALSYTSAKQYAMPAVRGAVLGLMEEKKVDVLVYPTRSRQPEIIDPLTPYIVDRPPTPSLTSIANVTQFPDVIVPAGVTRDKMPVTISFFGPAWSEPKLLAYAYSYEQATRHRVAPATTPPLPGERCGGMLLPSASAVPCWRSVDAHECSRACADAHAHARAPSSDGRTAAPGPLPPLPGMPSPGETAPGAPISPTTPGASREWASSGRKDGARGEFTWVNIRYGTYPICALSLLTQSVHR